MRWTSVVLVMLLFCLTVVLWILVSPFAAALLTASASTDWATTVMDRVLFTKNGDPMIHTLIWVLLLLMGVILVVSRLHITSHTRTTYGSSHYATWREAWPYLKRWLRRTRRHQRRIPSQRTPPESLFVIGTYRWHTVALTEKQQEEHVLVTGPSGVGKSSQLLIPNLLQEHGNRSLFIADIKQELYAVTVGAVARFHQIWVFAPTRPDASHGYNPLAHIHSATDANLFARCWVKNTGESKEPYWANNAQLLIAATVLHLRAAEPDAPFARLNTLLAETPFETLKTVLTSSPSSAVRSKIGAFLVNMERNERLVGSIMTDIGNRFQVFDSEGVAEVTTTNEIDFQAMIDVPTALYLSIPRSEAELHQPLLACFTTQLFRAWELRGVLPRGIACYLDEFANLGYIPQFETFISTARSLHVALLLAIQSASQLDSVYGKDAAKTIKHNANTHIVFPGAGLEETKYYSERIGDATVKAESRTERESASGYASTYSETKRPLMTADEIRTMSKRTVLVVPSSSAPMYVKTRPYFEDRRLAHIAKRPYHLVHLRTSPSFASQPSQQQSKGSGQLHPIIVDADQDKQDDEGHTHFLWEHL